MTPTVYFHIDEVARDAVVASVLKRKLAARGIDLVYGNRVESALLRRNDPFDVYVFPAVDLFNAYFPDLSRLQGQVIILPSESVGGLTDNVRRLAAKYFGSFPEEYSQWTERVSTFCLWGPSHAKAFETYGRHLLERVKIIGHPRFDSSCRGRRNPADGPVRVGIISRFAALNSFSGATMVENVYAGRRSYLRDGRVAPRFATHAERDWEDLIYNEAVDLRLLFEAVEALGARGVDLELRVHPRENRATWASLIRRQKLPLRLAPWDVPFQHWAGSMDHVVGPTSTSFFDCFALGSRPICTNALAPRRAAHVIAGGDDDNPILKFVAMPNSMGELVSIAARKAEPSAVAEYPEELRYILEQEAWFPYCSSSLDRLVDICESHAAAAARRVGAGRRLRHSVLVPAANLNQLLRFGWRAGSEQSSSFLLTRSRCRWIDSLAGAACCDT